MPGRRRPDAPRSAILADDARGAARRVEHASWRERYPALTPRLPAGARCSSARSPSSAASCRRVIRGSSRCGATRRITRRRRVAVGPADRDAYPFSRIEGEEVHEVAVGPVHAGIIEPGPLPVPGARRGGAVPRDRARATSTAASSGCSRRATATRAMLVAESIAGDTVIGHASAYCGAIEALARSRKTPARADDPRHRARARAAGQSHRRPRARSPATSPTSPRRPTSAACAASASTC